MISPYDGNENLLKLAWNGRPIEMVYVDCGRTREVNKAWHSIMSGFLGRICGVYHTSMTHRLPCPANRHRGKDLRGGALAGQASSITRRVLARTCPPRSPAACRIALVPSGRRIVPSTRRLVRAWHAVPPRTADMTLVYRAAVFPPPAPAQQSEGRTEDEPRRATSVSQGAEDRLGMPGGSERSERLAGPESRGRTTGRAGSSACTRGLENVMIAGSTTNVHRTACALAEPLGTHRFCRRGHVRGP